MTVRWLSLVKIGILAALVAGAVSFFYFTETGCSITPTSVRDYFRSLDPILARLLYIFVYIVGTVLLAPGTVLSFAGAVVFGMWEGTLYTWIGASIGATLAYYVARLLGRDFVEGLLSGRFQAFDQRLREHGFMGMLVVRLIPLFPFNGVNFGSGLTSIRPRDYVLATAIGIIPGTFVFQFLFATLGDKFLTEGFSWSDLLDPVLGIALGLFVVFIFLGKWLAGRASAKR